MGVCPWFRPSDSSDLHRMFWPLLYVVCHQTNAHHQKSVSYKKVLFSARMYKKTDQYDRSVEDYRYGVDALYEAEKFKETMRTWETDLWNY